MKVLLLSCVFISSLTLFAIDDKPKTQEELPVIVVTNPEGKILQEETIQANLELEPTRLEMLLWLDLFPEEYKR